MGLMMICNFYFKHFSVLWVYNELQQKIIYDSVQYVCSVVSFTKVTLDKWTSKVMKYAESHRINLENQCTPTLSTPFNSSSLHLCGVLTVTNNKCSLFSCTPTNLPHFHIPSSFPLLAVTLFLIFRWLATWMALKRRASKTLGGYDKVPWSQAWRLAQPWRRSALWLVLNPEI